MSLKIVKPGLLTTVQDLGRLGYQQEGVVVSGAMDSFAHRLANLLVGNATTDATLECTLVGPTLWLEQDHLIALTGGTFSPKINGKELTMGRPVWVKKGALLEVGSVKKGCRGYLAIAGGINVPLVMISASTYLKAGLGGFKGRAVKEGDVLTISARANSDFTFLQRSRKRLEESGFIQENWFGAPEMLPAYQDNPTIRVVRGPEFEWLRPECQALFWKQPFQVSPQSDRMGYRLTGTALKLKHERELLSTAVTFGTVQVPAQGNPIVLMADHQTTGGYPRIAQVITADFPLLAQVPPGQSLRFQEVTLQEAYAAYFRQEQDLNQLKSAIALKWRK